MLAKYSGGTVKAHDVQANITQDAIPIGIGKLARDRGDILGHIQ
ncbi:hypothetical protein Ea357_114 [Erwinia phage Ea35-70]|uniref:Uncharacterized protein n=1 Tax=Erwinia phage Ea35-70 TaxID=1429768 RepID=W6AT69_9CAUD|nr:hypothetical protein Ea357_114 [Erwinia phage Ea35-70]AHI60265.1 hypothetical protein Ea357_114 [Erwinia phage Ea35-70]